MAEDERPRHCAGYIPLYWDPQWGLCMGDFVPLHHGDDDQ